MGLIFFFFPQPKTACTYYLAVSVVSEGWAGVSWVLCSHKGEIKVLSKLRSQLEARPLFQAQVGQECWLPRGESQLLEAAHVPCNVDAPFSVPATGNLSHTVNLQEGLPQL